MAWTLINVAAVVVILWVAAGHLGASTRGDVPLRFLAAWLAQVTGALCAIAVLLDLVHGVPLWLCNLVAIAGVLSQWIFDRRALRPAQEPIARRRSTDIEDDHAHHI